MAAFLTPLQYCFFEHKSIFFEHMFIILSYKTYKYIRKIMFIRKPFIRSNTKSPLISRHLSNGYGFLQYQGTYFMLLDLTAVYCFVWTQLYNLLLSQGNPLHPLEGKSLYPPLHQAKVGLCPNLEPINKDRISIFNIYHICAIFYYNCFVCSYMKVIHT